MLENKMYENLESYFKELSSFFSLHEDSSTKKVYSAFKRFSKSFKKYNKETNTKILELLEICHKPAGETSIIAGVEAEKSQKIQELSKLEKMFVDSALLYLGSIAIVYAKFYTDTFGLLKDYLDSTDHINGFLIKQKRMKIYLSISFLSLVFSIIGFIPTVSIFAAVASIILFFIDRAFSQKEIKRLKEIGRSMQTSGKESLKKIKLM